MIKRVAKRAHSHSRALKNASPLASQLCLARGETVCSQPRVFIECTLVRGTTVSIHGPSMLRAVVILLWLPWCAALRHCCNNANFMRLRGGAAETILTVEDLTVILIDELQLLLEQAKSRQGWEAHGSPDTWAARSVLATRLPGLSRLNCCHVDKSKIDGAGRGVFASCDIAAGSLITMYPGDALRLHSGEKGESTWWAMEHADGPLIKRVYTGLELLAEKAKDYEVDINQGENGSGRASIIGDPDSIADVAYVGHIVNDCTMCKSEADRPAYDAADAERNAEYLELGGLHVAIMATRGIRRGEEIYVRYGTSYWIQRKLE